MKSGWLSSVGVTVWIVSDGKVTPKVKFEAQNERECFHLS